MSTVQKSPFVLLAACVACLCLSAMSDDACADDGPRSNWTLENNVLSLQGEILARSPTHFSRLFAAAMLSVPYPDPVHIELDSPGGDVQAALRIVRIIRSAQRERTAVAITIREGKRCYSTCLLLFAAGDSRQAAQDALFRFPNSAKSKVKIRILSGIADVDADLANHLLRSENPIGVEAASQLGEEYREFVTLLD